MTTTHPEFGTPLSVAVSGGRAVVRVAGDVDLLTLRDLREGIEVLLGHGVRQIDLHLADAVRIDTTAVEALAELHHRLAGTGGRLAVVGAGERLVDTMRRRGLGGLLH